MNENGNNKDVVSFVLGIVVVTIIYLLVQREFNKIVGNGNTSHSSSGGNKSTTVKSGGCGCGGGGNSLPTNPTVSPGANSLDDKLSFPNSVQSNGGMSHATFLAGTAGIAS